MSPSAFYFITMDLELFRKYCLSLPHTSEDMAFGPDYLLMRVCGKIFACAGLSRSDYFVIKTDPELALELRERFMEIRPAWHWNKKYWNQISLTGRLNDSFIMALISHSYAEVVKKLPRKTVICFPEVLGIDGRIKEIPY